MTATEYARRARALLERVQHEVTAAQRHRLYLDIGAFLELQEPVEYASGGFVSDVPPHIAGGCCGGGAYGFPLTPGQLGFARALAMSCPKGCMSAVQGEITFGGPSKMTCLTCHTSWTS